MTRERKNGMGRKEGKKGRKEGGKRELKGMKTRRM